jgi:transposase-like protein
VLGQVMTAYITGSPTWNVDDLVEALGCDMGVSNSTVSRIWTEIDEHVDVFGTRPLDHLEFPYVYVDATYVKACVGHHIVSRAVVIATRSQPIGTGKSWASTLAILKTKCSGPSSSDRSKSVASME